MAIIFDFFVNIAQLEQKTALTEGRILLQLDKKLSPQNTLHLPSHLFLCHLAH